MNSNELELAMQAFLNKGNAVQVVQEGERVTPVYNKLTNCKCGCEGNYTDHTMRLGEGRFADQR